jgi:hypothetical protein
MSRSTTTKSTIIVESRIPSFRFGRADPHERRRNCVIDTNPSVLFYRPVHVEIENRTSSKTGAGSLPGAAVGYNLCRRPAASYRKRRKVHSLFDGEAERLEAAI